MIDTLSFNALGAAPSFKFDQMASATRVLGAPFLVVRFWDMLCALKLGLPEECFAFGHQLDRFEQHGGEEGGVTLHFAEGKPPCRVRYLIDAGGLRSTTRKQLTGDSPIPWLRATFSLLPADRVECTRDSAGGGVPGELGFVAGDSLSVTTMGLSDGGVMWAQADLRDEPTARIGTSETALRTCLDARYNGDESWPATLGWKRGLITPAVRCCWRRGGRHMCVEAVTTLLTPTGLPTSARWLKRRSWETLSRVPSPSCR